MIPLRDPSAVIPIEATAPFDGAPSVPVLSSQPSATTLPDRARADGFVVLAASAWPETPDDVAAPAVAGFVASSFSPMTAEVARRCLDRRPAPSTSGDESTATCTAVIVASSLGDVAGARHVAEAVDTGARIGPLLFFQCVPNAVAGHIAARSGLAGPVICLGSERAALEVAELLLEDADADEVLLIRVDQAAAAEEHDRAEAVLLAASAPAHERSRA